MKFKIGDNVLLVANSVEYKGVITEIYGVLHKEHPIKVDWYDWYEGSLSPNTLLGTLFTGSELTLDLEYQRDIKLKILGI